MTYDEVVAAAFTVPADPTPPGPVAVGSPARRLRDAIEPLAMHSVWSRRVNEALAACGLDFLTSYVGGRAAPLGEPARNVVAAAFAVFEPGMIGAAYQAACAACPRDRLLAERERATTASLHDVLGPADVSGVVAVLRRALLASPHVMGRPLYAGLSELPWPDDPVAQLWRCCELLREQRGDGHVAAVVAAGLDPVEANVVTELWLGASLGSYSATRGWTVEQIQAAADRLERRGWLAAGWLTAEGRTRRSAIEGDTDRAQGPVLAAIGDELDAVVAQLARWSGACVAAGAFPPDPVKRAAG